MLAMANRQYRSVSPSRLAVEEGAKRARKGSEKRARRENREQRERTHQCTIQTHNKKCSFSIQGCVVLLRSPPPYLLGPTLPGPTIQWVPKCPSSTSELGCVRWSQCLQWPSPPFVHTCVKERGDEERGRRERERERQNRETEPRDRTERENRERQNREISALYSVKISQASIREAYPTSSDRSAGTNFSIAPRRSISWA